MKVASSGRPLPVESLADGTESSSCALFHRSAGGRPMNRPWQPAYPQAMQRHGGQTRPTVPAVKQAETPARDKTPDEQARPDENTTAENAKK